MRMEYALDRFHLFMDSEPDFYFICATNPPASLCASRPTFSREDLFTSVSETQVVCIMKRSGVVIWFLWGQTWIVAFRCGTFLFVLIIIFKYWDWRQADVGPMSAGDINPTSKRRWADIARPISTQRRSNTCSLVVFFHSIIYQNYFVPKSSQCWKQRTILVQSWHGYGPTVH